MGPHLAATGFVPAATPEEAVAVLLPAQVPEALADALEDALRHLPGAPRALTLASPMTGRPAHELLVAAQRATMSRERPSEGGQGMHCHRAAN